MEHLVLGQEVVLETLGTDRQGCALVMAQTSAGRWLQGELVGAGLAWVWPEGSDEETALLLQSWKRTRAAEGSGSGRARC